MSVIIDNSVKNQQNSPILYTGTLAQINASGHVANRWLIASDTFDLYRDNGTTYDRIGGPGTGTITGTGTAGTIPLFSSASVVGDSALTQGASVITSTLNLSVPGITSDSFIRAVGAAATCLVSNSAGTGAYYGFDGINFFQSSGTKFLTLVVPALALGTITVNLPSASGTIALTSALSSYLPLSGGTLTGQLNTTNLIQISPVSTGACVLDNLNNTSEHFYIGKEGSVSGTILSGAAAYSGVIATVGAAKNIYIGTNNIVRQKIDGSTGETTFYNDIYLQNTGLLGFGGLNQYFVGDSTNNRVIIGAGGGATVSVYSYSSGQYLKLSTSNATTGYIEMFDANANLTRGYLGYGSGILTGAGLNDVVLRGETNIKFATNGNNLAMTIDSSQKITFSQSIKTAAPSGGTAGDWKIGIYVAGVIVPTGYIEIDINGTLRKVAAL